MNKNVFNKSDELTTQLAFLIFDFMVQGWNNMNHLTRFVNNSVFSDT